MHGERNETRPAKNANESEIWMSTVRLQAEVRQESPPPFTQLHPDLRTGPEPIFQCLGPRRLFRDSPILPGDLLFPGLAHRANSPSVTFSALSRTIVIPTI